MKKLSTYLFLILFSLSAPSFADDIKDFQIEGISVGDNLLDHAEILDVTREFILNKKFKFYQKSNRLGLLRFANRGTFQIYDGVQFTADPKNYKIYTISGIIDIKSKSECINKQKEIIEELSKVAVSAKKEIEDFYPHSADDTGESIANGVYLDFASGDTLSVECYLWGKKFKEKGYDDNLKVNIETKEGRDFIQNEAY